jgi:chromosome segregation ATPase
MDGKTEIAKDALPIGGQPSSEDVNPSNPPEKVYKESEVNDLINQRHSKLDKQIAGLTKEVTSADERVKAAEDALKQYQEQIDQAELEAARGDPAKLKELQGKKSYKNMLADLETQKKELGKQRQQLERDKAETAEKVKSAEQITLRDNLWEIAAKAEINPQELIDGVNELKLTTIDQAKALAKRLGRPPEGETKTTTPISVPTTGGARGTPTQEQREKLSMEDYAALRKRKTPL